MAADARDTPRPSLLVYGSALVVPLAATLLRMSLTPLIGSTAVPFITFFPAVLLVAWYGGSRAGALSTLVSAVLAGYYFGAPVGTLFMVDPVNRITLLVFVIVGLGMALLSHAQRLEAARRRDAETAERRHRQRFETTLASIGDAVISTDTEGRIAFANPVAQSLVRWPEADMLGKHLDEVFHIVNEYTRATVDSPVARVLREGAIVGLANHTTLIARDGTEVSINDSAAPIRDETGAIQGTVLVFRDIDDRRRMERELVETGEGLQLALQAGKMGVWNWTMASARVKWSPALEAIHGLAPGAFGGTFEDYLSDVHPDDLVSVKESITRSLAEKADHNIEYRIIWPDGSVHWIQGIGRVLLDSSGNPTGMTGVCMDITERKQSENALRESEKRFRDLADKLLLSNEDLERFAFVASHDLQEPLRMITVYAQLLIKEYPAQAENDAAIYVSNIVEGTKRMRELLADLLTYTEIRGRPDEPVEAIDLNLVIETVRQNLKAAIDESGAIITSDRLPSISAHRAHFVPLFQNLIGNAIKYRSERPPRIHISFQEADGQLRFSVTDNGIGIDPEYYERIFVAFKRLHGRRIPGTGIGLAICQRVVERYGGQIWVESQAGQGSSFQFTLPGIAADSAGRSK